VGQHLTDPDRAVAWRPTLALRVLGSEGWPHLIQALASLTPAALPGRRGGASLASCGLADLHFLLDSRRFPVTMTKQTAFTREDLGLCRRALGSWTFRP
jgi:hypothetical protein